LPGSQVREALDEVVKARAPMKLLKAFKDFKR
jgi:hypothetical protein